MSLFDDISYNPFQEIFEVRALPLARIYRTNFWQKIKDTFYVFAGNGHAFPEESLDVRENHLGLFDYVTLGIPWFLVWISKIGYEMDESDERSGYPKDPLTKFFHSCVHILATLTQAIRWFTAAALTLAVSPFVGLVHLATKSRGEKLMKKVKALPYVTCDSREGNPQILPLGEFLEKDRANLADKEKFPKEMIEYRDVDYYRNNSWVHLFLNSSFSPYNPNLNPSIKANPDYIRDQAKYGINPNDSETEQVLEQKGGFSLKEADAADSTVNAFIELNIGNVAQKLEERGYFKHNHNNPNRLFHMNTTLPVRNNEEAQAQTPRQSAAI